MNFRHFTIPFLLLILLFALNCVHQQKENFSNLELADFHGFFNNSGELSDLAEDMHASSPLYHLLNSAKNPLTLKYTK